MDQLLLWYHLKSCILWNFPRRPKCRHQLKNAILETTRMWGQSRLRTISLSYLGFQFKSMMSRFSLKAEPIRPLFEDRLRIDWVKTFVWEMQNWIERKTHQSLNGWNSNRSYDFQLVFARLEQPGEKVSEIEDRCNTRGIASKEGMTNSPGEK